MSRYHDERGNGTDIGGGRVGARGMWIAVTDVPVRHDEAHGEGEEGLLACRTEATGWPSPRLPLPSHAGRRRAGRDCGWELGWNET